MDTTMDESKSSAHVDPEIFRHLQEKIDEEGKVRDVRQHLIPLTTKLTGPGGTQKHRPNTREARHETLRTLQNARKLTLAVARITQSILSRIQITPTPEGWKPAPPSLGSWLTQVAVEEVVLKPSAVAIEQQGLTVRQLAEVASKHPFYKYNGIWQRDIQALVCLPTSGRSWSPRLRNGADHQPTAPQLAWDKGAHND